MAMKYFCQFKIYVLALFFIGLLGCANPSITNTSRNATEQILLSTSLESCIKKIDISEFENKKVFINYSNLETQVDLPFVKGYFELHLRKHSIFIVKDKKESDYILNLISGTFATNSDSIYFGLPTFPIPIPETSLSVIVPEISIFKRLERNGFAKFSLSIVDTKTLEPQKLYDNKISRSQVVNYVILFVPFSLHNIKIIDAENVQSHIDNLL